MPCPAGRCSPGETRGNEVSGAAAPPFQLPSRKRRTPMTTRNDRPDRLDVYRVSLVIFPSGNDPGVVLSSLVIRLRRSHAVKLADGQTIGIGRLAERRGGARKSHTRRDCDDVAREVSRDVTERWAPPVWGILYHSNGNPVGRSRMAVEFSDIYPDRTERQRDSRTRRRRPSTDFTLAQPDPRNKPQADLKRVWCLTYAAVGWNRPVFGARGHNSGTGRASCTPGPRTRR